MILLKTYLVLVFSVVLVVVLVSILLSAAGVAAGAILEESALAGAAVIVSAGAAAGAGAGAGTAVVVADAESVEDVVPDPLPQDATKRPIDRASTLNFTNFMLFVFCLFKG